MRDGCVQTATNDEDQQCSVRAQDLDPSAVTSLAHVSRVSRRGHPTHQSRPSSKPSPLIAQLLWMLHCLPLSVSSPSPSDTSAGVIAEGWSWPAQPCTAAPRTHLLIRKDQQLGVLQLVLGKHGQQLGAVDRQPISIRAVDDIDDRGCVGVVASANRSDSDNRGVERASNLCCVRSMRQVKHAHGRMLVCPPVQVSFVLNLRARTKIPDLASQRTHASADGPESVCFCTSRSRR